MTLTAAPAPVEVRALAWASVLRQSGPTLAAGAALLWWGTGLVRGSGGRDVNALAFGLLLVAIALVAVRPWNHLPFTALAIPVALGVAALAVLPVGGVERSGAVAAGAYVFAGAVVVLIGSWATSEDRALVVAAAVCFAGLAEVCWAFPAWWGGGESAPGPMVGTFYWWNPYAVYLLAPALLGLLLVVGGDPRWRAIGWLTTPFAVSSVLFSTSRASIACLAIGWIAVGLGLIWRSERPRLAALRVGALSAVSVVVAYGLTSALVFRGGASPFGATLSRHASGQTVSADGGYRLDFWRQAISAFSHNPLSGTGYGRLLSGPRSTTATAYSPLAHNGLLQALGEGGLLLAIPTVLALGASVILLLLALREPARWSGVPFVAGVAGLALIAHGLVDTDWTYPADVGLLAICVGLAAAPRWQRAEQDRRTHQRRAVAGAILAAVAFISGGLAVGQHFAISLSAPNHQSGASS